MPATWSTRNNRHTNPKMRVYQARPSAKAPTPSRKRQGRLMRHKPQRTKGFCLFGLLTPMGDRSVALIHTLFTADSQQFAEDSQGFARIHAVVSRNTRPIRTICAPSAPHSRPIRADSRLRHKRFARIRGRYAPIRASTGSHAHRFAGIRGHSRVLIILRS